MLTTNNAKVVIKGTRVLPHISPDQYVMAELMARQPLSPCESAWGAMPTIQRTLAARSSGRVAGCGPDETAQQTLGGACCRSHAPAGG